MFVLAHTHTRLPMLFYCQASAMFVLTSRSVMRKAEVSPRQNSVKVMWREGLLLMAAENDSYAFRNSGIRTASRIINCRGDSAING
jgi:hypothetical protein